MNISVLLLSLSFLFVQVNSEAILSYKFKSKDARRYFQDKNTKGDMDNICVHWAPKVLKCGELFLKSFNNPAHQVNQREYETCITKIGFDLDFESEVMTIPPEAFKSDASFYDAYNRILIKYVTKIDSKYNASDEKSTLIFSFDFIAIGLFLLAAVGVSLYNRKPTSDLSSVV